MEVGNYEVVKTVYESRKTLILRAIRLDNEQRVILKSTTDEFPSRKDITRFQVEFNLVRKIESEHVIKAFELLRHENRYWMVLEDFGGEPLSLLNPKALSISSFLFIARLLVAALEDIHQAGVIHKDINPSNVLWNSSANQLKVIDFGISTTLSKESSNTLEGTLPYISPEQTGRINRPVDYRSDYYSVGATLYSLLLGHPPFEADDPMELVHSHIAKNPRPPHEVDVSIPPQISNIILKLMKKNAEERYRSFQGIDFDLEQCQKNLVDGCLINSFPLGTADLEKLFEIPSKLYGREIEMQRLLDGFRAVCHGKTRAVTISGDPGIGKSSLVQELQPTLIQSNGLFITGKFEQYKRTNPYFGFIGALRDFVTQLLSHSDAAIAQWRKKILAALGASGKIITDLVPELLLIIGEQPEVPHLGSEEAQHRFNSIFQCLIEALASAEHPLVIFLDDLQWADLPSLHFMKHILTHVNSRYLLLLGAYRDNEVSAAHPLLLTLKEIETHNVKVSNISLGPLNREQIEKLVQESLSYLDEKDIVPLSDLCLKKTHGNPFFLNQFLSKLVEEQFIVFDFIKKTWQYDIDQIAAEQATDNVVSLMVEKLRQLPQATREVLKHAAFIGSVFDLRTLSLVMEKSEKETTDDLWPALMIGIVLPQDNLYKFIDEQGDNSVCYRFLHDRVQQAAYTLMEQHRRELTHLRIGRFLLSKSKNIVHEDHFFDVVNHLNLASELLEEPAEKLELATLNLTAGRKALESAAYDPALSYFGAGRALVPSDGWHSDYKMAFALCVETARAAYLCGKFDLSNDCIKEALKYSKGALDRIQVIEIEMLSLVAQNLAAEAIEAALVGLKTLGVKLPKKPNSLHALVGLLNVKLAIGRKTPDQLINLPKMVDPQQLAVVRMWASIGSTIYFRNPELFIIGVLKMLNLALKHGNNAIAAVSYCAYAIIETGILGNIDRGEELGQLALSIVKEFDAKELKGRIVFINNNCIFHWKVHLRETLAEMVEAYRECLEAGDFVYSALSAQNYCYHLFFCGENLEDVAAELDKYGKVVEQMKQQLTLTTNKIYKQMVNNLQGHSLDPTRLLGEFYDQDEMVPLHRERGEKLLLFDVSLMGLILNYLFGEHERARAASMEVKKHLDIVVGVYSVAIFFFYDSLNRLATANVHDRQALRKVRANQKKLGKWADKAPMNHRHKWQLIEAEYCRVCQRVLDAQTRYEEAIRGAIAEGFINEAALACELAGKFFLSLNNLRVASLYMKSALYYYEMWGATAKVDHIEMMYADALGNMTSHLLRHPELKTVDTITETYQTQGTASMDNINLDVHSIIKASITISREIVMENLLSKLMRVVIENAGAQVGFLVTKDENKYILEAEGTAENEDSLRLRSVEIADSTILPLMMIEYVGRLREPVLIEDAEHDHPFSKDPYFQQNHSKSILCIPLVTKGGLVGILYLENNISKGAFTRENLEIINVLSSQIAISIENARLYKSLASKNEELTVALAKSKVSSRLKSEFIANTSHELRTPLNSIINMPDAVIKTYFRFLQIATCKECKSEFELDKDEKVDHATKCPSCQAPGTLRVQEEWAFHGDAKQAISYLSSVVQSGKRLLGVVDDILDISKLERGRIRLYPEEIDVETLIDEVIDLSQPLASKENVSLRKVIEKEHNKLVADRVKLSQVLINLISNAIKFSNKGQDVCIRATTTPDQITFSVADQGIGISRENQEIIFDSFRQVDGGHTRKAGGAGLGLAIAKQLVTLHGGKIWVESALDQGSTFFVTIPFGHLHVEDGKVTDAQNRLSQNRSKGTILVIDDDVNVLEDTVLALEKTGFHIETQTDPKSVIARIEETHPKLVILDILMPEMSGIEVLKAIRNNESTKKQNVLVSSAYYSNMDLIEEMNAHWIAKPWTSDELAMAVKQIVD